MKWRSDIKMDVIIPMTYQWHTALTDVCDMYRNSPETREQQCHTRNKMLLCIYHTWHDLNIYKVILMNLIEELKHIW